MSQLNGNDIDDLFRRASDRYPLRTDKADWDRVAADLDRDPSLILPPISEEGDGRRRRRFFWLFLLLPLGGAGYFIARPTGHGSNSQPIVTRSQPQKESQTSSSPALRPLTTIPSSINPNSSSIPSGGATTSGREIATGSQKPAAGGIVYNGSTTGTAFNSTARGNRNGGKTTDLSGEKASVAGGKTGNIAESNNIVRSNSIVGSDNVVGSGSGNIAEPGNIVGPGNTVALHPMGPHRLELARTGSGIALDVKVASRKEPAPAATTKLAKPLKPTHFYAGLLVSPDLSMVKFQTVKGVGTTYGLLLGYNINRKWAIESGLYLDRKKYYTDGEYFSTKNIYMQPNVKISTVDGICNMWEIPLNVRYNLSQGEKTKWFATAGFSTYLMTKENYDYQLESTSGGNSWPLHKQYTTARNYLFSVVNLSVGYEQKIGNVGNLRIEPYLRLPTAGIGTGSLPIMSAGLNIGITRRIW